MLRLNGGHQVVGTYTEWVTKERWTWSVILQEMVESIIPIIFPCPVGLLCVICAYIHIRVMSNSMNSAVRMQAVWTQQCACKQYVWAQQCACKHFKFPYYASTTSESLTLFWHLRLRRAYMYVVCTRQVTVPLFFVTIDLHTRCLGRVCTPEAWWTVTKRKYNLRSLNEVWMVQTSLVTERGGWLGANFYSFAQLEPFRSHNTHKSYPKLRNFCDQ